MGAIICFLGSQIAKIDPEDHVYETLMEHEIKIMNFHMESSYSAYLKVLKIIIRSFKCQRPHLCNKRLYLCTILFLILFLLRDLYMLRF